MPEDNARAKACQKRYSTLKTERGNFESQWQEVAELMNPNRKGFTTQHSAGQKHQQKIYDSTAPWALQEAASQLHGMLTNPATRWVIVKTKDRRFMENREVLVWLDEVTDVVLDVFGDPDANFNSQSHEVFLDLMAFGNGIMYMQETIGKDPGQTFKALHLAECLIAENKWGLVDTMYRRFQLTLRELDQMWGQTGNFSEKLIKLIKEKPDDKVWVLHEVRPREDRNPFMIDKLNMPFSSLYILEKHQGSQFDEMVLDEGGFEFFPYLVPRWSKMNNECYGRGPGMFALPDVKMLNTMVKTTIKAAQKVVDPPLMVPDDGFFLPVNTKPSGLNFFRAGVVNNEMLKALETKGNINLGLDMINEVRQQILRAFFLDKFKLEKEKLEMTRFEAEERVQENLRAMSPMTGRIESEYLNLVVSHTIEIQAKQRRLPPAPQILLDNQAELKLEYTSPLARAQKSGDVVALQGAMNLMTPLAQIRPELLMNFDGDEIVRSMPEMLGLPARFLNSKGKVAAMRQAMQQQEQEEREKIDAAQAAKVQADLNKSRK